MVNIEIIDNQFRYWRKRGFEGDIALAFDLSKEEIKCLQELGYEISYEKGRLFKKGTYKVILREGVVL